MLNDDLKGTSRQWIKVNFSIDIFRVLKHIFFNILSVEYQKASVSGLPLPYSAGYQSRLKRSKSM